MFCSKCGNETNNLEVMFCPKCGNGLTSQPELPLNSIQRKILSVSAGQKYPILRLIAVLYKIGSVIIGILGVIFSLGSCAAMPSYGLLPGYQIFLGWAMLFGSIVLAVSQWALGEGIMVFLDMEESIRKVAEKE
ncbi:MAG: hypothetical protein H6Q68_764 [Firmicutes bacterium]|nr:hypothetical protein [Bacillota bacterium]